MSERQLCAVCVDEIEFLSAEIKSLRAQLAAANSKLAALNLCEPGFLDRKLREMDEWAHVPEVSLASC